MKINWIIIFFQKNKQQQNITILTAFKTEPRHETRLVLSYQDQP